MTAPDPLQSLTLEAVVASVDSTGTIYTTTEPHGFVAGDNVMLYGVMPPALATIPYGGATPPPTPIIATTATSFTISGGPYELPPSTAGGYAVVVRPANRPPSPPVQWT